MIKVWIKRLLLGSKDLLLSPFRFIRQLIAEWRGTNVIRLSETTEEATPQPVVEEEDVSSPDTFLVPREIQHKVVELPCDTPLSVFGHVLDGIDGIRAYCYQEQGDDSQPYIINRCKQFPCFDAYDRMYEHRFFRNYLICCDKQDADAKAKALEQRPQSGDFCLVSDSLPDDMRPMVYYRDESGTMLLAF